MAITKLQKTGKGWHGDSRGHASAGKKGGNATAILYGDTEFYHVIGRKGGQKSPSNFKNNPERARKAGAKGGRTS